MSLPPPTLPVPTLSNDQLSFQGVTLGASTPFGLKKLEGLEKTDVRSGNTERPRTRGAFVGTNLLKTRTITASLDVGPPFGSYSNLPGALAALRKASSTEGTTEYPLWVQLPGFPLVCAMARVIKKSLPYDVSADLGQLIQGGSIQWEATDPYLYAAPSTAPSVGLPGPTGGFAFPLGFNLSFGGAATPNQLSIQNTGNVECWPVLVITGPCLNPSVQQLSIAGSPTLSFQISLNAGDRLVVDCDEQSILYYPSGQSVGAAYPNILGSGSTFFSLLQGTNLIAFNSQDTSLASGTLAVWSTSVVDGLL